MGAIASAVAALFAASYTSSPLANPTGAQVVAGTVNVNSPAAGQMNITQKTPNAIVNWNSFSIGSNEAVRIAQPSAASTLLNRVAGNDPSVIAGLLQANGKVFLINPAGVIFAPGSSVNVGSMIASTLNISDADFLAGNYHFVGASAAAVSNAGSLTAQSGGTIALLGATVSNTGTVSARLGTVALGAGGDITVDFAGDGLTTLKINQGAASALIGNTGTLAADGGTVVMSAQTADALAGTVINQQGIVRAQSLSEHNGHILLDGGTAGVTQVSGTLDATGGAGLKGGQVDVTGYDVALLGGARVDASGAAGGGVVHFGGGPGGADPAIRNANAIWMAPTAALRADALVSGDGGNVGAYSNAASRIYGTLSATGGAQGGNGGLIETSGHYLDTAGATIDASAPKGKGGTWKLDPYDVYIVTDSNFDSEVLASTATPNSTNSVTFTATIINSTFAESQIETPLDQGTSVIVSTGSSGPQHGDIYIQAPISVSQTSPSATSVPTLTFSAAGFIADQGGSISSSSGALNLVFDANQSGAAAGTNSITITGGAINTNGGSVTIGAGQNGQSFDGASVDVESPINTTATGTNGLTTGSVTIHGMGAPGTDAVVIGYATAITTSAGSIEIEGNLGATPSATATGSGGVELTSLSSLTTDSGAIRVYGVGVGPMGFCDTFTAEGIDMAYQSAITTNTGSIDLRGAYIGTGTSSQNVNGTGVNIFDATVKATGAGTSVSIAGSTNEPLPGVQITEDCAGCTLVSAGSGGSIALRAMNDNSTSSLVIQGVGSTPLIASSSGVLSLLPGGVNSSTFGFASGDALPIGLFTTVSGLSIDAATYFGQFQGFRTIVLGSSTQTGKITVGGEGCSSQTTSCTQEPVFTANLTLANPGTGSQGIQLLYGASLPGYTLTLSSAGAVTDPGGIQAAGLLLAGPGSFTLTDPQNAVGVLAMVNAGNVNFLNSRSFVIGPIVTETFDAAANASTTLDGTNSTLTGSLVAQAATGNIGLGGGTASTGGPTGGLNTNLSAGGSIDLVADSGVFTNAGSGALSAGGAWRIWAQTWNGETRGNVQPNTAQPNFYGCTFGSGCSWGGTVPLSGDHFVYVARPTVTVTANGATRVVGAPNPTFTFTVSGLINGDTAAGALSGGATTSATSSSPAGQYAIDPSFASGVGYIVNDIPGTLTVTGPLTVTAATAVIDAMAQSGLQAFFGTQEQTFVYENNLKGTNICVGSNQPLFTTAPPGDTQDILAVEWKRVRSQPNLNSCMLLNGQHGCGDF
jgi:filamentous hemagglutinin family protein